MISSKVPFRSVFLQPAPKTIILKGLIIRAAVISFLADFDITKKKDALNRPSCCSTHPEVKQKNSWLVVLHAI